MTESEQIINLISKQTINLMTDHWPDIADFLNGYENIKVDFSHRITYSGQARIIESTINFDKRIKDSSTEQLQLVGSKPEMPAAWRQFSQAPGIKRRRGRPRKNAVSFTQVQNSEPDQAA